MGLRPRRNCGSCPLLADALSSIVHPHIEARFCHARIAAPVGDRTERAPAENNVSSTCHQALRLEVRRIPFLPSGSVGFKGGVAARDSFEVNAAYLFPIGGPQGVQEEIQRDYPAAGAACLFRRTTAETTVPKIEPTTAVQPIHNVICGKTPAKKNFCSGGEWTRAGGTRS